ncbi:MAG TPA: GNAT family N-acetyltransferase [Dehalococcoidia bacterium]|nr:GNAT family N-acetyltransferase [Dehalococcoidia bacterium]
MPSLTPLTSFQALRDLREEWAGLLAVSSANTLFLTPQWQEVWWDSFGDGKKVAGFCLRGPEGLVALASLAQQDGALSFLGNSDTFDYNDFMVRPGHEAAFYDALLGHLEQTETGTLTLASLRDGSPTLTLLPDLARQRGYRVEITQEDVAPGVVLPATWDDYVNGLSKKDRHELRRKLRRLETEANWRWYSLRGVEEVTSRLDDFFALMRLSRVDKAEYLTPQREEFFRRMARRTAELDLLRLSFMEMDGKPVAASICFDYGASRLLYNSGNNPEYGYYSVGLLLHALCLREAIEKGMAYFDFLRGAEPYKYHLGGQDRILYQMVVQRS